MHLPTRLVRLLLCLGTPSLLAQTLEIEPNNSAATAQHITLGDEIDADLGPGDQDWFSFSTEGGNIPLYLTGDGATAVDARLALFDATGTAMLGFSDDVRGVLPALNLNLEAGTYLIRIDGFSATASGRYFLDTAQNPFDPYTDREIEPNDDINQATLIRGDSEISGKIGPKEEDVDYYRIVLPATAANPGPARYGLWIQVTDGDAPCISRTRLDFLDAAGALLDPAIFGPAPGNGSDFNFRKSELRCWPPGTYHIRVAKSTSTSPGPFVRTGNYRLEVRVMPMNINLLNIEPGLPPSPPEPPGSHDFDHAVEIQPGQRGLGSLQTLAPGGVEEDHWSFRVTHPTVVMFQTANANGAGQELADTTLAVLTPDRQLLDFSRNGNILEPATTSHARVTALFRLPGLYRFRVSSGPNAPVSGDRNYALEVGAAEMPYVAADYLSADLVNQACVGSNGRRPTLAGRGLSPFFPLGPVGEREVATMGTLFRRRVQDLPPGALCFLLEATTLEPAPLTSPGAPGCALVLHFPLLSATPFAAPANGVVILASHIPFAIGLRGLPLYDQVLVFDATANALGVTLSNYAVQIVGDRSF